MNQHIVPPQDTKQQRELLRLRERLYDLGRSVAAGRHSDDIKDDIDDIIFAITKQIIQ